jgi:superfamily II DNA or RNA helicase
MVYRSSFSQHNRFAHCPLMWYMEKILKIYAPSDMSHAIAGKVVHTVLENYYNEAVTDMEKLKELFNQQWDKSLSTSFLNRDKDTYWIMCLNGINLNRKSTTTELKIFFDDILAYLDCVDYKNDAITEIWDWKTSKRSADNEAEYVLQMKVYAWVCHRKYGKLPQKCTVYYLRNVNNPLEYIPTMEDMEETKKWYYDILAQMEKYEDTKTAPNKCCNEGKECFMYCQYKDRCARNNNIIQWTLHLIGNYIFIEGEIPPLLNKGLHKKFSYTLKNAKWIKRNNPQAIPVIDFWYEKKRMLPVGFIHAVQKTLRDYAEHIKKKEIIVIKDRRIFDESRALMPEAFVNGKTLRPYQLDAIKEFLPKKIGMFEMGTGSGKTLVFTELIRQLNHKTLIVVNRVELLKQTRDEIKALLGIEVGMIGDGEFTTRHITVATIQSLSKNAQHIKDYLRSIRFIIVDEAQFINMKSYWKLAKQLVNTEYRLAVSGTCRRTDGNDLYLNAMSGDIVYRKSADELIKEGYLVEPMIRFLPEFMEDSEVDSIEESVKTDLINEEVKYHKLYQAMIMNNTTRNNLIARLVDKNKGNKILILTRLIDHGKLLSERFDCPFIYGDSNKEEREQVLTEFKDKEGGILVGSMQIFAEGLNILKLDMVINASGMSSDIKEVQSLGRLLRKHAGKNICYYYDFMDSGRIFSRASRMRFKAFLKEGHDVEQYLLED